MVRLELVIVLPEALTGAEQAFCTQADRHDRDLNGWHTFSRRSTTSNGQRVKGYAATTTRQRQRARV